MSRHDAVRAAAAVLVLGGSPAGAAGSGEHSHDEPSPGKMIEAMRDMHADHEHGHDFEAMEGMTEEDMHRAMDFLMDIGLALPPMSSERGATAFLDKGCIVCHAVNEVGGEIGPAFNAEDMPEPMNTFEFAARMWRGAPAMVQMQEDLLGEMITLNGQELADIIAFVHDREAQSRISVADIPEAYRALLP